MNIENQWDDLMGIKMQIQEDKVVLTVKEILKYLLDVSVVSYSLIHKSPLARKSVRDYWRWRNIDKSRFSKAIYRLKQQKFIEIYREGKDKYLELTPKGLDRLRKYDLDDLTINSPKKWDHKWRLVIFDIPDDKKTEREIFRERLKQLEFITLQESVLVFPFDCKAEIDFLCSNYSIKPYVKYIVADFFEGDDELIRNFLDRGVFTKKMIQS
jgi:DNA-binding MarR family transcriptional regulator